MIRRLFTTKVAFALVLVASFLLGALVAYTILWLRGTRRSVINEVSPTNQYLHQRQLSCQTQQNAAIKRLRNLAILSLIEQADQVDNEYQRLAARMDHISNEVNEVRKYFKLFVG